MSVCLCERVLREGELEGKVGGREEGDCTGPLEGSMYLLQKPGSSEVKLCEEPNRVFGSQGGWRNLRMDSHCFMYVCWSCKTKEEGIT